MAEPIPRPGSPKPGARTAPARRAAARQDRPSARGGATAPGPAAQERREGWRRVPAPVRWGGAVVLLLVLIVVAFALFFQWNMLRGPISRYVSGRMHRTVVLQGNLTVHPWSFTPSATAEDVIVGNPGWNGKAPMLVIPRLTLSIKLTPLLRGEVILPLVEADHPTVRLARAADGRNNWTFGPPTVAPKPLKLPPIRRFIINDGQMTLDDAIRRLRFVGTISSNEQVSGAGRGTFTMIGKGMLNQTPFLANVTGGPLLNVDPRRPYPFDADVRAGATHVTAVGDITHPFDLAQASAKLHVSGPDMADLYYLTGLSLPNSPPYDIHGDFGRAGSFYAFRNIGGRIGSSDVAGHLAVDKSSGRARLTGDIASRRLKLADMTAVMGGGPRKMTVGTVTSPEQQAMAAKLAAEHRILPDAPLDISRVRNMDAHVRYRADTVDGGVTPVRAMSLTVDLDHGLLVVDPLSVGLPNGVLSGSIRIDARHAQPRDAIDVKLLNARLQDFLPKGATPPAEGGLEARARLSGSGLSVRGVAADADGDVTLVITHGQIRQSLAELLGINVTKGLFLLLSHSQQQTELRCAVAHFHAQNGIMTADRLLLDTGVVLAKGSGTVNLRDETLDLKLQGKSKKFRLVRIMAPITMKGSFEAPKVGVDVGKAAGQLAISGLLGAFVSPLAVLLPFVDGGLAKDADCQALLAQAASEGAPIRAAH